MEVKCINKRCYPGTLTQDKVYLVKEELEHSYGITDDLGKIRYFPKEQFKIVKEEGSMRQYAGWEICKMLNDKQLKVNDKLKIENEEPIFTVKFRSENCLYLENIKGKEIGCSMLTDSNWKLTILPKEVTVKEAMRASIEGKTIICELYENEILDERKEFKAGNIFISPLEYLKGHWYIKEDADEYRVRKRNM